MAFEPNQRVVFEKRCVLGDITVPAGTHATIRQVLPRHYPSGGGLRFYEITRKNDRAFLECRVVPLAVKFHGVEDTSSYLEAITENT